MSNKPAAKKLYAAIDQGTTSSRFIVFDEKLLHVVAVHQIEHRQITPQPGWLQHDAEEIFSNVVACMKTVLADLAQQSNPGKIVSIGITNQRETTVAWSKSTGKPLYDAIVWSDARTQHIVDRLIAPHGGKNNFCQNECGLPCSTYFSAVKMRWMLENVHAVKQAAATGDLLFGTIDSWLIYKLTNGEMHATDVTNASRTMLMDIRTRKWSRNLCDLFGVPMSALPKEIFASASPRFGHVSSAVLTPHFTSRFGEPLPLAGTPISGCIGDQSGALVGQLGFTKGQIKNTFGTGCFLLANVGHEQPVFSKSGLLTTIAFQMGDSAPCFYALEGAVAGAGSAVQWLRDKMQIIKHAKESEILARSVPDSGGVSFVPAFGGLLAPHWCPGARGTILGMSQQTTRGHIVRATLEAVTQQVSSLVRCVEQDLASSSSSASSEKEGDGGNKKNKIVTALKVDGGMAANNFLVQLQADMLGVPVLRPQMLETTAKGAALCAAVGAGHIKVEDLQNLETEGFTQIAPRSTEADRARAREQWERAVKTVIAHSKL